MLSAPSAHASTSTILNLIHPSYVYPATTPAGSAPVALAPPVYTAHQMLIGTSNLANAHATMDTLTMAQMYRPAWPVMNGAASALMQPQPHVQHVITHTISR